MVANLNVAASKRLQETIKTIIRKKMEARKHNGADHTADDVPDGYYLRPAVQLLALFNR